MSKRALLAFPVALAASTALLVPGGSVHASAPEISAQTEGKSCDAMDGTVALSVHNNGDAAGRYEMKAVFGQRDDVASAATLKLAAHDHKLNEVSWPWDQGRMRVSVWTLDESGNRTGRVYRKTFGCPGMS